MIKVKVKVGLAWKRLKVAMFRMGVFGNLGMTKNNRGSIASTKINKMALCGFKEKNIFQFTCVLHHPSAQTQTSSSYTL